MYLDFLVRSYNMSNFWTPERTSCCQGGKGEVLRKLGEEKRMAMRWKIESTTGNRTLGRGKHNFRVGMKFMQPN